MRGTNMNTNTDAARADGFIAAVHNALPARFNRAYLLGYWSGFRMRHFSRLFTTH